MKKYILSAIFAGFLIFGNGFISVNNNTNIVYANNDSSKYSDFEGIIPSSKKASPATKKLSKRIKNGQVNLGDIIMVITKTIDFITKIAGTIAVIFLIYGGYQYMLGSISDDKEGAKKTIQYAIIGLIVTFMAYLIVNLIKVQFLGG